MFRGKESSNRIELSWLVQDLLNFGVLGSLQLWGGGRWVGGIWGHGGCPHTHAHAHMHIINIIWFCLKIYNLSRHPYLWVDGWVNGWAHVKPLKSNKSWPNRDNSIMDILDILLDILLKPPQPFIGLFFAFLFVICVKRKEWVLYPFFAFDATSHRRKVAIWRKCTRNCWR